MGVQERRAREFRRREQDILEAALALFAGEDWQAVTIDQIARRAEVAKGTVYLHFDTKEELFARLALVVYRRVLAGLERLPADRPPLGRLGDVARVFWDEYLGLPLAYRRVVQLCENVEFVARLPERTRSELVAVNTRIGELVLAILAAGVASGAIPERPLPVLMFTAQSALFGAIRQSWTGCIPAGQQEQYFEATLAFLVAGLTGGGAGGRRAAA